MVYSIQAKKLPFNDAAPPAPSPPPPCRGLPGRGTARRAYPCLLVRGRRRNNRIACSLALHRQRRRRRQRCRHSLSASAARRWPWARRGACAPHGGLRRTASPFTLRLAGPGSSLVSRPDHLGPAAAAAAVRPRRPLHCRALHGHVRGRDPGEHCAAPDRHMVSEGGRGRRRLQWLHGCCGGCGGRKGGWGHNVRGVLRDAREDGRRGAVPWTVLPRRDRVHCGYCRCRCRCRCRRCCCCRCRCSALSVPPARGCGGAGVVRHVGS